MHIILLENCQYSELAYDLVNKYNIKSKITNVSHSEKNKFKSIDIATYPQIYMKRQNKHDSFLIGGYDNLNELFTLFYKKQYNIHNVEKMMAKYNMSKKLILRFIELIN